MERNVELKLHTTFRIGGPAAYFTTVSSEGELRDALAFARAKHLPWFILGGGSNMLVSDEGYRGLVIRMRMRGMVWDEHGDDVLVSAAAGEIWDDLVRESVARGFGGLENLSFIPGTVGAAPVQNIGAYGTEVKDTIARVEAFDAREGRIKTLTAAACAFGYRDSIFKRSPHLVVLSVTFRLSRAWEPNLSYRDLAEHFSGREPMLKEVRDAIGEIRAGKFPDLARFGTAGSYFKNPVISRARLRKLLVRYPELPHFAAGEDKAKLSLAWILDRALHLKGVRVGDVGLFERQPLVFVNYGDARAQDVRALADDVARRVHDATGITIEPEVMYRASRDRNDT